mmetsp:Transcript_22546/g.31383  ORF Transcript_22546/g.31383 Transcript_22546/m.31383 type:complete len:815 (-) Transcript_22546:204-2648(-)|eukprot:CAMPEP_0196579922 /NCGR_PEP_ID=MMETSP1081-20130531/25750_1 /TAXON_ID=36882 /ORGANISM="Pyramimonas amylifera, Strain CCMP720" /LENGTH=814 /DNA_ID=CAMNT_0041899647 /DNA_START=105 /DNA_END=2549 /DNA_ORIENTATION=+
MVGADVEPAIQGQIAATSRAEKVKAIFSQFDKNDDGRLSKEEMSALVVAVNPSVRFSDEQIAAILDEVFRTYGTYIDGGGLSLDGLRRTYDDGAGDVDRDFDALGLSLASLQENTGSLKESDKKEILPLPIISEPAPVAPPTATQQPTELSPAVKQLLDELEEKLKEGDSKEVDASNMQRGLAEMRHRADTLPSRSPAESFDAHMEMGAMLGVYQRWEEALRSYRRAVALRPEDARAHFRIGNAHYQLHNYEEARDSYERALQVARQPVDSKLLPQIHVNLGVALENNGFLMGACEHYREAAILNPQHHRSLKHLGSALFALGELRAAEEALQHSVNLRPDFVDAQVDLGNALYGLGNLPGAMECFEKAVDLDGTHLQALYNLGNVKREQNDFETALTLYERVLSSADNSGPTEWTWKVNLNRTVCLLALGRGDDTMKSLEEVYAQTGKRVEIYELKKLLKKQQKGKGPTKNNKGLLAKMKSMGTSSTFGQPPQARAAGMLARTTAPTARFARNSNAVSTPDQVKWALEIRAVQMVTKLGKCLPMWLRREASDSNLPDERRQPAGAGAPPSLTQPDGKIVRKASVERIFRRLLGSCTNPQTFQVAMKHINQRMLAVLDTDENGTVDLGNVLAVVAILCEGPMEDRQRAAYDILLWRARKENDGNLPRQHAINYFNHLYQVYKPKQEIADRPPVKQEADGGDGISHQEFAAMFEDEQIGFHFLSTLEKLEKHDRVRHHGITCAANGYTIVGPRYFCTNGNFSLCAASYAEKMLPSDPSSKSQEQYIFREVTLESNGTKFKKLACYSPASDVKLND